MDTSPNLTPKMRNLLKSLLMVAAASPLAAQATPQGAAAPTPPVLPAVGEMAPDFTIPWTNAALSGWSITKAEVREW